MRLNIARERIKRNDGWTNPPRRRMLRHASNLHNRMEEPELLYPFAIMGSSLLFAILFSAMCVRNWEERRGRARIYLGLALVCLVLVFAPVVHIMIVAPGMLEWNPDGTPLRP